MSYISEELYFRLLMAMTVHIGWVMKDTEKS